MAQLVDASTREATRPVGVGAIIAMGLAVAILEGYDIQAMGVAAPKIIPLLGLSSNQTGWVFSGSMIGLVMGALFGGWLADRVGRKPILLGSVIAFGVFSLATIFSYDYLSLFLFRILTGLGLGGAVPNLIAVANEVSRSDRRTTTTTMMFAGMPAGGAIVSLVAQYALPHSDWRLIFIIGGLLPLAIAPIIAFKLPETGLSRYGQPALERPNALSALLGAGQAASTLLLWTGFVLTLIVLYLLLNWLPLLATAKGVAAADASIASLTYNLGSIPGALILGFVVDRRGLRGAMIFTYGSAALVMLALAASSGYYAIAGLSFFAGMFVVGTLYVLYAISPIYYPPTVRGTGAGAAVAVGRLGSILGPLIAGFLLSAGATASQVVVILAPAMLIGGVAIVALTFVGRPYVD